MRVDGAALGVAAFFALFALAALGVWIPWDVESGAVETVRRRTVIGDALAPTAAAVAMAVAAAALAIAALRRPRSAAARPDRQSALFAVQAGAAVGAGLVVMVHAGPLAVAAAEALGAVEGGYRALRDTAPWKYLGYLLGGAAMVAGLIAVVEQRVTASAAVTALAAAAALAAFYDLPFDHLLLPPNGDQ